MGNYYSNITLPLPDKKEDYNERKFDYFKNFSSNDIIIMDKKNKEISSHKTICNISNLEEIKKHIKVPIAEYLNYYIIKTKNLPLIVNKKPHYKFKYSNYIINLIGNDKTISSLFFRKDKEYYKIIVEDNILYDLELFDYRNKKINIKDDKILDVISDFSGNVSYPYILGEKYIYEPIYRKALQYKDFKTLTKKEILKGENREETIKKLSRVSF